MIDSILMLDTSNKAIENYYELWLPEDEETGEPDEDLPAFGLDQYISAINQNVFTLNVKYPRKALKSSEDSLPPTNIQSLVESTYNSMIEKQTSSNKFIEKDNTYHASDKPHTGASYKRGAKEEMHKQADINRSSQVCCNCTIF